MSRTEFVHDIAGPAGRLEAILDLPEGAPRAAVVFAHPHPQFGGTLQNKVVYQAAKALARVGCAVMRFNFRGVGASEGKYDDGIGEAADFQAALDAMAARYPGLPLWAAGFSFGSWIAMTCGADDPRVSALIGIGAPVGQFDYSAVLGCTKPKFLLHGERDEVASVKEIRKFYSQLAEPKELVEVDGATHMFDGRTQEVGEAIEDLLADFEG